MELHELVLEMKQLERRLTLYEEKYGLLSLPVRVGYGRRNAGSTGFRWCSPRKKRGTSTSRCFLR